jgi:hypothetical protein
MQDIKEINIIANYIDINFNEFDEYMTLHTESNGKILSVLIRPMDFLNCFNKIQVNRVKKELIKQIEKM